MAGRIRYTMADGTVVEAGPGEHMVIEPGHLAEVVGDETCVSIGRAALCSMGTT